MPCAEEGGAAMPSTRASPRSGEQLAAPWITWFPLTVAGAPVGAIVGRSATRPDFEHERVEGATLFAQHTAALLDVSPAVTDSLTGLLNRRGFDERLSDIFLRDLGVRAPDVHMGVRAEGFAAQAGGILQAAERLLRQHRPS